MAEKQQETPPTQLQGWRDLWRRFWENRYLAIGTTALVVALLGWLAVRFYLNSQNEACQLEMRYAEAYFRKDSFEKALKGTVQFMGFEQLAREYRWTSAGNLCRLYQGLCHLKLGQYEAAVEALEGCDIPKTYLGGAVYGALAGAYSELKAFDKAARAYEKAAKLHQNSQTSPLYLLYAGLSYELAKDFRSAARAYEQLLALYPLAGEAPTAQKHLERVRRHAH